MDSLNNDHYLRHVTELGDSRPVVASQAIYAHKNIKLVDQGIRIDSRLYERLVAHKLTARIDDCLSLEDGVTQQGLCDYARNLIETCDCFGLFRDPYLMDCMLKAFYAVPLLPPLAFKLSVLRDRSPDIFDHSVRIALVSLYLAIKNNFSSSELAHIAAAALFHDIGVLHVDPVMLDPRRKLTNPERRHLYSHPITAYLILREYSQYHPDISTWVFQHHERMDGSGYPRGLRGSEISFGAQILMLAEVANVFFENEGSHASAERLAMMLKLNPNKLNWELSNHLIDLLAHTASQEDSDSPRIGAESGVADVERIIDALGRQMAIFQDWTALYVELAVHPQHLDDPLLQLVSERVGELQRAAQDAGIDAEMVCELSIVASEEADVRDELRILARELGWQLKDIIHEARRRWSSLCPEAGEIQQAVAQWLERSENALTPG